MLKHVALGLSFTLAFLYGQSANAVPQSDLPQHVLEVEGPRPKGSAFGEDHVTSMEVQSAKAAKPHLGERIPRANWSVTCDSAQPGNECNKAIDGDLDSFWHTAYGGGEISMPHSITIDLKSTEKIGGIGIFPRKDNSMNGIIASHEVYLSRDGKEWSTPVAYGTWWGDDPDRSEKFANFETTPAQFVRLIATSEVNGGPWTSIAELNVYNSRTYTPPQQGLGRWGPTIDFPIVPAGAWVEPISGKVVAFSSYAHDRFNLPHTPGITLTATWDPATRAISSRQEGWTGHDMFCPGMSFDANGRMIVTGGNSANKTSIYDFINNVWITAQQMRIPRGYQASVTCADGRIFTIGGSWNGGKGGKNGEIYNPASDTWTLLPGCIVDPMLTNDDDRPYRGDNHAWLFGWKNNTVFQAGPSKSMHWYTVTGSGGIQDAGSRGIDDDAMCGVAVMYDASEGKILTAGGASSYKCKTATTNAHILTLGDGNSRVSVSNASHGMFHNRIFHHAIVLPSGDTFVTGGQQRGIPFSDLTPQFEPEIYSPTKDSWTKMAPNSIVRAYHSFGLLLPDATVLVGGGGLCGDCEDKTCLNDSPDETGNTNHFDAQIYTPQYLLTSSGELAKRPVIFNPSPAYVEPGDRIIINTDSKVKTASLIRYGSSTHGVNTDQRRISLDLVETKDANKYECSIPSDAGVATPGYWMLFVMNPEGVPSLATNVHIMPA